MQRGFTLIELLVVIAIIGLLSSVVLASLNAAREKARDARRKHDLDQIRKLLFVYYDDHGNWIENGSGCGYAGNGEGWFNYEGGSYPKSIAQCLVDAGYVSSEIIDPSGNRASDWGDDRHAYMKYDCGSGSDTRVTVFAKLETEPMDASATDGTCCPGCDSNYGMNYYVEIQ